MAYVITEPCVGCKNTICVMVCPVEAFREDKDMLVIDPLACIDCGACVPECPVDAIFAAEDVPEKWKDYVEINARKAETLPVITECKE